MTPTQQERVLALLQERPQTTADFLRARIPRFSARIEELRKAGYDVVSERLTASSFRYELVDGSSSLAVDAPATPDPSTGTQAPSLSPAAGPLSFAWVRDYDGKWSREFIDVEAWLRYEDLAQQTLSEMATATVGRDGRDQRDPTTDNRRAAGLDRVAIPSAEPASESEAHLEAELC